MGMIPPLPSVTGWCETYLEQKCGWGQSRGCLLEAFLHILRAVPWQIRMLAWGGHCPGNRALIQMRHLKSPGPSHSDDAKQGNTTVWIVSGAPGYKAGPERCRARSWLFTAQASFAGAQAGGQGHLTSQPGPEDARRGLRNYSGSRRESHFCPDPKGK